MNFELLDILMFVSELNLSQNTPLKKLQINFITFFTQFVRSSPKIICTFTLFLKSFYTEAREDDQFLVETCGV
jgi:hypothetical protein